MTEERRVAGSAAITAVFQIAAMAIGGVIALLVVGQFGKTPRSDGVFAAYGLYGLIYVLAATLRSTVVARLAESPSLFRALDRFIGGALVVFAVAAVPLVILGQPLAELITGSLPHAAEDAARSALAIFWLAAGAHLLAALGAAALAVRAEFALPGVAYVIGGAVSAAVLVALADPVGTNAVPVGLAVGAALTSTIIFVRLVRVGYRPELGLVWPSTAAGRAAVVILIGSIPALLAQVVYAVNLAFAAHLHTGSVTLFSYAFFAALLVIGATSVPATLVLAAPVAQDWDRRPESLEPHLVTVFRAGLILVAPVLALAALSGDELIQLVLAGSLNAHDADTIVSTFLVLTGVIVVNLAVPIPILAAFAAGRYGRLAALSITAAVLHVAVNFAVIGAHRIQALAAVSSVDALVFLLLLLRMTFGAAAWRVALGLGREAAVVTLAAAAAFVPPALIALAVGSGAAELAAWIVGTLAFVAVVRRLPGHWDLVRRMLEPVLGNRVALQSAQ